ncbi:MAG: HAD-IIA family hydrolase [Micromonosporaceae bacterium]|nr:HAD-IIA family hydrolase [Micromonosporaceae bacterium]
MSRLIDGYDLVILDLDGVVYLGSEPVPGAVEELNRLRRTGHQIRFATNNASRLASEVTALLAGLGLPAHPDEVVTSAQVAAQLLGDRLPSGAPVLVVGADALRKEVAAVGLTPVDSADVKPLAVIQGYGPALRWSHLAEACVAVRAGAYWVATNTDRTLPSPRGPLPGNGALVAVVATALGRGPDVVVGKPQPALFQRAAQQAAARAPLVVGDRLDTDIQGAHAAGMDSLLVLTGVAQPADLLTAPPAQRPSYLATNLAGLFTVDGRARATVPAEQTGWRVRRVAGGLELSGAGAPLDGLRALCTAAWAEEAGAEEAGAEEAGREDGAAGGGTGVKAVRPVGPEAEAALRELRITVG